MGRDGVVVIRLFMMLMPSSDISFWISRVPAPIKSSPGGTPFAAFSPCTTPAVLRPTKAQAQTTDMCVSCTFKGGSTNHGMPSAGKFTDVQTLANGMAIMGVYAATDQGGVYFWPGDGSIYPMTQAMGVNSIWFCESLGNLTFAATDAGVYNGPVDMRTDPFPYQDVWPRLGAMSLKTIRVQVDESII